MRIKSRILSNKNGRSDVEQAVSLFYGRFAKRQLLRLGINSFEQANSLFYS